MLKFVDTTASNYSRKRKDPPPRACDSCKRKKKRCPHTQQAEHTTQSTASTNGNDAFVVDVPDSPKSIPGPDRRAPSRRPVDGNDEAATSASGTSRLGTDVNDDQRPDKPTRTLTSTSRDARDQNPRFIGDMNPEVVFEGSIDPDLSNLTDNNGVGRWLAQHLNNSAHVKESSRPVPAFSVFGEYPPAIRQIFLPILEEDCLSTIPTVGQREAFLSVYFRYFQPIFPIVDQPTYEEYSESDPRRLLLEQGMCLAASAHPTLRSQLRLKDIEEPVTCAVFGKRIFGAMRVALDIGLVSDSAVVAQALVLMAFYYQGRSDSETASTMAFPVTQYVHSTGLHIPRYEDQADCDHAETLFCCIWAFDRLHAALQGKPVLMHERDIARSLKQAIDVQQPPFRLLLTIVELLDRVIKLYRPGNGQEDLQGEFSLFEDIVLRCGASKLTVSELATIETLYHAVCILSCRASKQTPSAAARMRQLYSTERLTNMATQENLSDFILFPFFPYAVSLALGVSYREMRRSQIPMLRSRARVSFEANCRVLQQLGDIFCAAATMADKGMNMLREIDRVYFQVVDESRKSVAISGSKGLVTSIDIDLSNEDMAQSSQFPMPQDLDPFYFTEMPHLDPFEMFDPDFELGNMDAFITGNLDMGGPIG